MERFMEQYQAVYKDMYRLAYYYMGNAEDAPAPGWQGLACDGQGGVKTVEDGIKFLVLAVDAQARSVVVKL